MVDFLCPEYLKVGNPRQRQAWQDLQALGIFRDLAPYDPVLAGTVPIEIDVANSDLDIICYAPDLKEFEQRLTRLYDAHRGFLLKRGYMGDEPYVLAQLECTNFPVEIFGQAKPVTQQNAYRHMVVEHRLLLEKGPKFRQAVVALKESGMKTEPAFAQALDLDGDPYDALLNL